jgi:hypothetical protein
LFLPRVCGNISHPWDSLLSAIPETVEIIAFLWWVDVIPTQVVYYMPLTEFFFFF